MTGAARMTVVEALLGAIRRLSRPECQHLFEDFTDQAGRGLTMNLETAAESPADNLAGLYFADGNDRSRCRNDRVVAAFTTPGAM